MYEHHRRAIARVQALFEAQPEYLALLIGGSLVRGWGRVDSDVDIILVVTEDEYAYRAARNDLLYLNHDLCDYEGGYVDGKIVDLKYLREVAARGNEPTRSAFVKANVAFSRLPELEALLQQITLYPEVEREARMQAFVSEVTMMRWFVGEAAKRDDAYLMTRAVADLVLFGSRAILAYNRLLYPYHKWLMQVLREAPEKPDDLLALTDRLLAEPNPDHAAAYVECLQNFRDWGVEFPQAVANFTRDREWHWRRGEAPVHDW